MAYEVGLTKQSIDVLSVLMLIGNFLPAGAVSVGMTLDRQRRSDFRENMLNDLNWFLDRRESKSNEGLVTQISNYMRDKYDWLENYCLVYDDVVGFDKHCFNGHRVDSLHRNGRCGIVFYRTKGETPRFSNRSNEAKELVDKTKCGFSGWFSNVAHAEDCYDKIVPKINDAGIDWAGFVVFSGSSPSLKIKGTFSTSVIDVTKSEGKVGWNTVTEYNNARAILLLK